MALKQIKPQKARGHLEESLWLSPAWIAERKYDGFRAIAQFTGKVVRFTSGRLNTEGLYTDRTQQVPHLSGMSAKVGPLNAMMSALIEPLNGTVLDMEIIPSPELEAQLIKEGGGQSKAVGSIINSLPDEAVRKQIERGWLRAVVFDCLVYKGRNVRSEPLVQRRILAMKAVEEWANPFVSFAEWSGGDKRRFYEKIVKAGGEGVVLKHLRQTYGDESLWVKVKKTATADVIITGFKDARKESKKVSGEVSATKYAEAGLIGAILCSQIRIRRNFIEGVVPIKEERAVVEVASVSGFPDDVRADATKHPSKYLNKVLRIKHYGREPTGRFRHPVWDGLREDKLPRDCVFDLEES